MLKTASKTIYPIIMTLLMLVSITVSTGAADDADVFDTVELKNGDKITGTLLTDTLTITTPYSVVPLEKNKISEINITPENKDHDVIVLNEGGLVEGTIEELNFSFKTVSGETVSLEKDKCTKIIIKHKK
jgi:hypothetical protein